MASGSTPRRRLFRKPEGVLNNNDFKQVISSEIPQIEPTTFDMEERFEVDQP